MFTATLFIITANFKLSKWPSTGERINRLLYSHIECNKGRKLLINSMTWMTLKSIILSKISQT